MVDITDTKVAGKPRLNTNSIKITLRISKIPSSITRAQLEKSLNSLALTDNRDDVEGPAKRQRVDNINTLSLAPSPSVDYDKYQVATVTFRKLPSDLESAEFDSTPIWLGEGETTFQALFDSHFEGLTPLNNPASPIVDIVAVTGFAGHAFGSWRSPSGPEMWLRDFVPDDLKISARILTYGYDSRGRLDKSKIKIGALSDAFLESLKDARNQKGTVQRPIIFIGHSLGGVIIKTALRTADCHINDIHNADILSSCQGIIFFGVPNIALEATALKNMVKGNPSNHLIEDLSGTSQFLEHMGKEFCRYFMGKPTKIVCFQELKDSPTVDLNPTTNKWERSGPPIRMVTPESALHPPAKNGIGLDADHSSMVKYKSKSDENYRLVISELSELLEDVTLGPPLVLLNDNEQGKVLTWLSNIEYMKHRATAKETILENTGRWLLNKKEFQDWKASTTSSILWLHGIPGSGKTKLICAVIDFLDSVSTKHEPIVYFYCNRNDSLRRNATALLQSLVKQLSLVYSHLPHSVVEVYNRRKKDCFAAGALSFEESRGLLISLLGAYPQTTIVIDALDENDSEECLMLLNTLQFILDTSGSLVRIFVASRDDGDIKLHLERVPNLFIKAGDNRDDIERFVRREVEDSIKTKRLLRGSVTEELKEQITSVIVAGAKEMFQWANLQIRQLYPLRLEEDVRDSLGKLPRTLSETYSKIMDQMSSQTPREQKRAKRALMWIMCACIPLNLDLWAALTFFPQPVPEDGASILLDLCKNLVTYDQQLRRVVFAHLSVEEYLESTDNYRLKSVSCMALETCLSALDYQGDSFLKLESVYDTEVVHPNIQLARYCILYWSHHAEICYGYGIKDREVNLLRQFLGTPADIGTAYLQWARIAPIIPPRLPWVPHIWYKQRQYLLSTPPSPLFVLACFRFGSALQTYWKPYIKNIDIQNDIGHTSLLVASFQGNVEGIKFLLDNGANVNAKPGFPALNSLMAAIISHQPQALSTLINAGASISANGCKYRTVLEAAAREGNKVTVETLLSATGNTEITEVILEAAAANAEGSEIMATLLEKRPTITPEVLRVAAANPNGRNIVNILLLRHPDLEITEAALVAAAKNSANSHILETLLSTVPGTPITQNVLIAAVSSYTGTEKIKMLLSKYPDINITEAVLRKASKQSFPESAEVILILLSRCPHINSPNDIFCGIIQNCYRGDSIHLLLTLTPDFDALEAIRTAAPRILLNGFPDIVKFHALINKRTEHFVHVSSRPLMQPLSEDSTSRVADQYLFILTETRYGCEMMRSLLLKTYNGKIMDGIFEAATRSQRSQGFMCFLLGIYPEVETTEVKDHLRRGVNSLLSRLPKGIITERLLEAVVRSKIDEGIVRGLVSDCPDKLFTKSVVGLIANNYVFNWIDIILSRFPYHMVDVTEATLLEAIHGSQHRTMKMLLNRKPETFTVIEIALRDIPQIKPIFQTLLNIYPTIALTFPVLISMKMIYPYPDSIATALLDRLQLSGISGSELVDLARRSNEVSNRMMKLILESRPDVMITELVLVAVVGSKYTYSREMMKLLLESRPDVMITEPVLVAMAERISSDSRELMKLILDSRPDVMITELVLVAVVKRIYRGSPEIKTLILDSRPDVMITEPVLVAMEERISSDSRELMKLILDSRPDVMITEAILVSAAKNEGLGFGLMELLLGQHPELVITEPVLVAAAQNKRVGSKMTTLLLAQ